MGDFWRMLPWHLRVIIEAERDERDKQAQQEIAVAWHTAAFGRVKKMPKLKDLFTQFNKKSQKFNERDIVKYLKNYQAVHDVRNKN